MKNPLPGLIMPAHSLARQVATMAQWALFAADLNKVMHPEKFAWLDEAFRRIDADERERTRLALAHTRTAVALEEAIRELVRSDDPESEDIGRDMAERWGVDLSDPDQPDDIEDLRGDHERDRIKDMRAESRVLEGVS